MGVGVPEFGLEVFAVQEDAVVAVLVGEAAEGVVGGGVIAGFAGELAGGVLFAGAPGAAVDVNEDDGVALIDEGLREVERGEGVGVRGVVELVEEGGELGVGGGLGDDEG